MSDVDGVVNILRYYAGWCDKIAGQVIPSGEDSVQFLLLIF